jgi:hypothetical protein
MKETMGTITESYFGIELVPFDVVESCVGTIYICTDINGDVHLYDSTGVGAGGTLSSIDVDEFNEIYNKTYKKD